jgi:hypothetical protein
MDTTAIMSRSYKMCILLYVEILCSMALHHRHVFDATTKQDQAATASFASHQSKYRVLHNNVQVGLQKDCLFVFACG